MDCQNSWASALPWVWVVELLTSSSQVDPSLLLDLLEKIPDVSDDNCKKARELVSLRILECLYAQKGDAPSVPSRPKIRINTFEQCEDVLLRILRDKSILDLKAEGANMLKWDIEPFTAHKKSRLTNCSLMKLKDAILTSHPSLISLRESSGLPVGDQPRTQMPTVGGDCNGITTTLNESHVNSSKRKFVPEDYLYCCKLPAKRKGTVPAEDANANPCKDLIIYDGGVAGKADAAAKKDGLNLLASASSKNTGQCGQRERCISRKKARVEVVEHNGSPRDSDIGCTSSKRPVVPDGGSTCEKRAIHNGIQMPNEKSDKENRRDRDTVDAGCDKGLHEHEAHEETDKLDQDIERNDLNVPEDEEIDSSSDSDRSCEEIAAKKNEFLRSQCTLNDLVTDSAQLDLCIKCQGDENLLVCCSDSCPLVVHENCLGFDATVDKDGKYYCPYCVYFRAVSMYKKTKEKAANSIKKMKEMVSSARKELVIAFCSTTKKRTKEQPQRSYSKNQNHSKQKDSLDKSNEVDMTDVAENVDFSKLKKVMETIPSRGKDVGSSTQEIPNISKEAVEERNKTCEVSPSLGVGVHHQMAAPEIHASLRGKGILQFSDNSDRHLKTVSKDKASCPPEPHLTPQSKCSPSMQSTDAGETSKNGKKHMIPYSAMPQLRRKRLRWSSEEIEKLKEAVHAFYNPDDGTYPWRQILEFGAGIFDKTRTPVDLKDKWRNICKATD